MVSSVGLVKALGGGWDVSQMARETGTVAAPAPAASDASAAAIAPAAAVPQKAAAIEPPHVQGD
jgi:hypothetical protein